MCGRFTLSLYPMEVEKRFNRKFSEKIKPNFNASPTQFLPIVSFNNFNSIDLFRWGMPLKIGNTQKLIINTKSETICEKPFFEKLMINNRCLVLADSFIEWNKANFNQPYRFMLNDKTCFAFAAIYNQFEINNQKVNCFSIITTTANSLVAKVHNRMPVILDKNIENEWINPTTNTNQLFTYLKPYESNKMLNYPISKSINNVKNNELNLLEPIKKIEENYLTFDF